MTQLSSERRTAEAIARLAGRHILRERAERLDVSLKAPDDVVTNVDKSTERLIVDRLRDAFPDDTIAGEEFGESHRADNTDGDRTWLIDPIDGTLNFSHGIPLFCVSIALQVDGETVVAVIYDPNRDEMFSASQNGGAHLDGVPISVSSLDDASAAVLVTGFPLKRSAPFEATLDQFELLTRTCRGIRRLGSAAIDLAYVAAGRMEAFWEYSLKPWDTAAGILLVEEAGGQVTTVDGGPFDVHAPSILATNGVLHDELLELLQSVSGC